MPAQAVQFDADQVADYETAGWRAYYDREWPRLLRLTVALCQEQFRIPFPLSLRAAYDIVRASVAWAPVEHDEATVLRYLTRFYRLAARYAPIRFDPEHVAPLELQYYEVHRRLAGQPDKTELIATMTRLHAALFDLTEDDARESAEWRVRAMNTVDGITSGAATDIEGDWRRIAADLRRCYQVVGAALNQRQPAAMSAPASSNDYHFITHWRVPATAEEVSDVLADPTELVDWWPSVYLDVRVLEPGDEQGVGRVVDLYTKGWLPYTLRWQFTVTESRHPHGFTLVARGDFDGRGIWTITDRDGGADITYDWQIRADKPLLRYGSFLFKPIFAANHRWAMAKGEESLRLELARRHARTPEERAAIAPPPAATTLSPLPLLAGVAAIAGVTYAGVRLARRQA
jgi:hypothetical protein